MARRTLMPTILSVDRDQVIAFRLQAHHLSPRVAAGALLEAAGACGIQNTPPGSAALALHARVTNLKPDEIDRAIAVDKTLLQVWSLRASPHIVPTKDAVIFAAGLLPRDEESIRFFIRGASEHLARFGLTATDVVECTAAALTEVLDGRELTKDELGVELAQRMRKYVAPQRRALWDAPDGLTHYGESIARFALSVVALQGLFCIAPRRGNSTTFIRTDQWLGAPLPAVDPAKAQAELVRRYLSCYGPSTYGHLAEWAGIAPSQAKRAWELIETDLVAVELAGKQMWLNTKDGDRIQSPPQPKGVRLLPPHDPFLQMRDRETLLPDKALHSTIWRYVGNPGAVIANGRLVALWRPRKQGKRLGITVSPLARVKAFRSEIEAEAERLAPFRDCSKVEVEFAAEFTAEA